MVLRNESLGIGAEGGAVYRVERNMRVGLLGGTFNPIHDGHLLVADAAHEQGPLDVVYFIPAYVPPHKDSHELAGFDHRVKMAELATASRREWSMVSTVESARPGPSYTVDTVRIFHTFFKDDVELFLIIGSDTVPELKTWREIGELVKLVGFIAVDRGGRDVEADLARAPEGARIKRVSPATPSSTSSTWIRSLKRDRKPSVPKEVADYIEKHRLYG
jgi:nicotinate-nucleotide adenylyltransferase